MGGVMEPLGKQFIGMPMSAEVLEDITQRFSGKKIEVVGEMTTADFELDRVRVVLSADRKIESIFEG